MLRFLHIKSVLAKTLGIFATYKQRGMLLCLTQIPHDAICASVGRNTLAETVLGTWSSTAMASVQALGFFSAPQELGVGVLGVHGLCSRGELWGFVPDYAQQGLPELTAAPPLGFRGL